MSWFTRLCRQSGLVVHHVLHPKSRQHGNVLRKTIEQKKVSPTVTLRRTTIEEIEVRRHNDDR